MEASILIVTRNRREELWRTLSILRTLVDFKKHEIKVFFDGITPGSREIKEAFPEVKWSGSSQSLGASRARSILYKEAKGDFLFGFDDDAHPLDKEFVSKSIKLFKDNPKIGIIGFSEIKGCFTKDEIPKELYPQGVDYLTNDFMGCGFVIKKYVYENTRGFPQWIDIYGEESCLALETLALGYDILFTHKIAVNHRVDIEKRKNVGGDYFRFGKQLKNTSYFYLVYYPFPLVLRKLVKLYVHNFKKYGMINRNFFKTFFVSLWQVFENSKDVLCYRKPVTKEFVYRFEEFRSPEYHKKLPK